MGAHQSEIPDAKFACVNAVAAALLTHGTALLMQVEGPLTHPLTDGPPLIHAVVYCDVEDADETGQK